MPISAHACCLCAIYFFEALLLPTNITSSAGCNFLSRIVCFKVFLIEAAVFLPYQELLRSYDLLIMQLVFLFFVRHEFYYCAFYLDALVLIKLFCAYAQLQLKCRHV